MKALLLSSCAIICAATVANAQAVSISGEGRMGVVGLDAGTGWTWVQENRLTLNFNAAVEADHGLTFGAWTRARMASTGAGVGIFSGSRVWVEANNFRLTFGNADGALTNAGYLGGGGIGYVGGLFNADAAGLDAVAVETASTGSGPTEAARLDYSFENGTVSLSHVRGGATEFGANASFDAFTVAVGYTNMGGATAMAAADAPVPGLTLATFTRAITLSAEYDGGSWGAGVLLARISNDGAGASPNAHTNWSLSANADLGGGNLYGYVGRTWDLNAFGVNYAYDLGGGATISAGIERLGSANSAAIGVAFEF